MHTESGSGNGSGYPLVIAHRGASGYLPEHTESAYRLAIQLGADAVEPDVVPTKDGVLLIRHENELGSTTDVADRPEFAARYTNRVVDGVSITGWFSEDFTWEELQTLGCRERIPQLRPANTEFDGSERPLRLAELLRLIDELDSELGRRTLAVIEIKHAHYFAARGFNLPELLRRELKTAGWLERTDQLVFESFELGVLLQLATAGVQGRLVMLNEHAGKPADAGKRIRAAGGQLRIPRHHYRWYRSRAGLRFLCKHVSAISVEKCDLFADGCSCRGELTLLAGSSGRVSGSCKLGRRLLRRLRARLVRGEKHSRLVRRANARGLEVFVWTARPENAFLETRYRSSGITDRLLRVVLRLLLQNPLTKHRLRRAVQQAGQKRAAQTRTWFAVLLQNRLRCHGNWVGEYRAICGSGVAAVFADHPDLFKAVRDGEI